MKLLQSLLITLHSQKYKCKKSSVYWNKSGRSYFVVLFEEGILQFSSKLSLIKNFKFLDSFIKIIKLFCTHKLIDDLKHSIFLTFLNTHVTILRNDIKIHNLVLYTSFHIYNFLKWKPRHKECPFKALNKWSWNYNTKHHISVLDSFLLLVSLINKIVCVELFEEKFCGQMLAFIRERLYNLPNDTIIRACNIQRISNNLIINVHYF